MNPIKKGVITTPFEEMRPLLVPPEKRDHVHGALDIAPRGDNNIYAPVAGYVWGWKARRERPVYAGGKLITKQAWPEMPKVHGRPFPWCNYFYDMYGGVIILEETDERDQIINTHLICHSWQNQIFNKLPLVSVDKHTVEEEDNERWPIEAIYTDRYKFKAGDKIGTVGNAGYSSGHHIHWEIHPGRTWAKHADRINPLQYM